MLTLRDITRVSILAATGWILMELIQVPLFPQAPYLRYDAGDIPVLIAALALGPWRGVAVAAMKVLLFALFHPSPDILVVGAPMNFLAGASFALVAGTLYCGPRKTRAFGILGLTLGGIASAMLMIGANLTVLPLFLRIFMPQVSPPDPATLRALLVGTILPFNLIKSGLNGVLVFFVYKRISPTLKAWNWEAPMVPVRAPREATS